MGNIHIQIIEPGSILPAQAGLGVDLVIYADVGTVEPSSGVTSTDGSLILPYDDAQLPFQTAYAVIRDRKYPILLNDDGSLPVSTIIRLENGEKEEDPCCFELTTGAVLSRSCYTQLIRVDQPEVKKFMILETENISSTEKGGLKKSVKAAAIKKAQAVPKYEEVSGSMSLMRIIPEDLPVETTSNEGQYTETQTQESANWDLLIDEPIRSTEALLSPMLSVNEYVLGDNYAYAAYGDIATQLVNIDEDVPARFTMDCETRLPWDFNPIIVQACRPHFLHALKFCQEVVHVGEFAGRVVGSETILPNQKKQISTITFRREDTNSQEESFVISDSLSASQSRQRDVQDLQSATLQQASRGSSRSSTASISASASFPGLGGVIGVSGGYSSSSASSSQSSSRQMAAAASQNLSDSTQQASQSLRSQTVTVMQATSQEETTTATTEVIKNYNMSRSLNLVSREVLSAYDVCHRLDFVKEAVNIPLDVSMFSESKALRWRDALEGRLRDPALNLAFDAIERRLGGYEGTNFPPGQYANSEVISMRGFLDLEVRINPPKQSALPDFNTADLPWWLKYNTNFRTRWMSSWDKIQDQKAQWFLDNVAPQLVRDVVKNIQVSAIDENGTAVNLVLDASALTQWNGQSRIRVGFNSDTNLPIITRNEIRFLKISLSDGNGPISDVSDLLPLGSEFIVRKADFEYESEYLSGVLVRDSRVNNDLGPQNDDVFIRTNLSSHEKMDPKENDVKLRNNLLQELNTNLLHYHEICFHYLAIFQPSRLRMLLDRIFVPGSTTQSIRSIIGEYIGAFDGCVCFEVAPGYEFTQDIFDQDPETTIDWLEHYGANLDPDCQRIVLPTSSVHTKATLGCCVIAEEIDRSLNVQWLERYDEDGPQIGDADLSSRFEDANKIAPTTLATSLLSIQEALDAPDYEGVGDILGEITKKDIFRDLTGLAATQTAVKDAFNKTITDAGAARGDAMKLAQAADEREKTRAKNFDSLRARLDKDLKKKTITPEYYKKKVEELYNSNIPSSPKQTPVDIQKKLQENNGPGDFLFDDPYQTIAYSPHAEKEDDWAEIGQLLDDIDEEFYDSDNDDGGDS